MLPSAFSHNHDNLYLLLSDMYSFSSSTSNITSPGLQRRHLYRVFIFPSCLVCCCASISFQFAITCNNNFAIIFKWVHTYIPLLLLYFSISLCRLWIPNLFRAYFSKSCKNRRVYPTIDLQKLHFNSFKYSFVCLRAFPIFTTLIQHTNFYHYITS